MIPILFFTDSGNLMNITCIIAGVIIPGNGYSVFCSQIIVNNVPPRRIQQCIVKNDFGNITVPGIGVVLRPPADDHPVCIVEGSGNDSLIVGIGIFGSIDEQMQGIT